MSPHADTEEFALSLVEKGFANSPYKDTNQALRELIAKALMRESIQGVAISNSAETGGDRMARIAQDIFDALELAYHFKAPCRTKSNEPGFDQIYEHYLCAIVIGCSHQARILAENSITQDFATEKDPLAATIFSNVYRDAVLSENRRADYVEAYQRFQKDAAFLNAREREPEMHLLVALKAIVDLRRYNADCVISPGYAATEEGKARKVALQQCYDLLACSDVAMADRFRAEFSGQATRSMTNTAFIASSAPKSVGRSTATVTDLATFRRNKHRGAGNLPGAPTHRK